MTPFAVTSSRTDAMSRPELLVPSPATSMMRRAALNGERSSWANANSSPALIEVRSANERGSSIIWSPILRAEAASPTMVQSITSLTEVAPDHSTKQIAILPCGPDWIASTTRRLDSAAA